MGLFRVVLKTMGACSLLMASACVYTDADFKPNHSEPALATTTKNAGDIAISEKSTDKPHRVLGDVKAYGRSVNLLSSDPTRADLDEALRKEAAKQGADAVILVRYKTESAGLNSKGKMVATGKAIAFK